MSIQSEINRISGNVSDAFDAVAAKGGTVGNNRNSNRLAAAIRSIPSGEGGSGGGSEKFIIDANCSTDDFWAGAADITLNNGTFADALDAMYAGQDVVINLSVVEEAPGEDPIITDAFLIPLLYGAGSETELAGTTTVRFGELLFTVSVNLFADDTAVIVSAATDKLIATGELRELEDGDEAELAGLSLPSGATISQIKTSIGAYGIYAIDDANIDFWTLQDALYASVPIFLSVMVDGMQMLIPVSVTQVDENTIAMTGTMSVFYFAFNFDIAFINDNDETHVVMIQYTRQGGILS